nr:putative ribonuclease H-like domain-containing protein [Tanacetum cinerariifolium]
LSWVEAMQEELLQFKIQNVWTLVNCPIGDRKSTTGGCQFLSRRLISWQCKKQTIIATSTTEAEYVAAASCYGQVLWIPNQLLDYGDCFEKKLINVDHIHTDENVADLLTKPFDAGRFQYLVISIGMCKLFLLLGKLSTVSVFLGFGLTFTGTSKNWGVLRILMISLRLIPLDFHPMVDFIEASPFRTVPESSLRRNLKLQDEEGISSLPDMELFENLTLPLSEEGTQILTTVDGIHRTVPESSLRRNLKLQDEEGISSLPDMELFENLTLMGYNISPNQKFTFQKGQFSHQWKIVLLFDTILVQ